MCPCTWPIFMCVHMYMYICLLGIMWCKNVWCVWCKNVWCAYTRSGQLLITFNHAISADILSYIACVCCVFVGRGGGRGEECVCGRRDGTGYVWYNGKSSQNIIYPIYPNPHHNLNLIPDQEFPVELNSSST